MASSTFTPPVPPVKRLAEFLQEQQEPYTLVDMCISKRFLNKSRTDCGDGSNHKDFGENLKGSSCICKKSSRMLKLITNKIISYRKCSIHFSRNSRAQTEDSTFSDSTPGSWSGFSKYVKDGVAVLIQTNKLLLHCANEAINIQGKQGRSGKSAREMLVPDGLRETTYKQICLWRKQPGDHKNITQLIDSDISTQEEWSDFLQLNRDTEIEIGDSILDDIVTELINLN